MKSKFEKLWRTIKVSNKGIFAKSCRFLGSLLQESCPEFSISLKLKEEQSQCFKLPIQIQSCSQFCCVTVLHFTVTANFSVQIPVHSILCPLTNVLNCNQPRALWLFRKGLDHLLQEKKTTLQFVRETR